MSQDIYSSLNCGLGSNDDKKNIMLNASKKLTEGEMKAIRRREYYNRRVKTKFAPGMELDNSTDEDNKSPGNSPDSPDK